MSQQQQKAVQQIFRCMVNEVIANAQQTLQVYEGHISQKYKYVGESMGMCIFRVGIIKA